METIRPYLWPLGEWILVCLAIPALLFPGVWSLAGLLLVMVAWGLRRFATGRWRAGTSADPALALFLLTALVGLSVSVDRDLSLNRVTVLLLGWLLYESTVITISEKGLNRNLLSLCIALALALVCIGLIMTDWRSGVLFPFPLVYDHLPQINLNLPGSGVPRSGGLLNPRAVTSAALLLWPLNGALALVKLTVWQRITHALAALSLVVLIVLTQSPQGFLALGASLLFLLLWKMKLWGRIGLVVLFGVMSCFVIAVMGVYQDTTSILLTSRAGFGLVARLEIWARAGRMFLAAPLTGIGLNNYPTAMDAFYPGYGLGPEPHAHNLYLQTLTDQGILGLIGLLLFFAIVIWVAVVFLREEEEPYLQAVLAAVPVTLVGVLVYGLLESPTLGHKAGIFLWVLLGMPLGIAGYRGHIWRVKVLWSGVALVTLLVVLPLLVTGYLSYNIAVVSAQQALSQDAIFRGDPEVALSRLEIVEGRRGPLSHLHLVRLMALLQVETDQPFAAALSFRQLAALEAEIPLYWWAPAHVLSGTLPAEPVTLQTRAAGLARVYRNWRVRFPDRFEPVVLLAYLHADALENPSRAVNLIERAIRKTGAENPILAAVLADLQNE